MFRKQLNIKSLAPLRSSDRRKLIDLVIGEFSLQVPVAPINEEQDEKDQIAAAFRSNILPQGSQSANFITTIGPESRVLKGTIYVGSHGDEPQRILWIKLSDEGFIPTVYTLWRHPGMVPLLHTPDSVIQKMKEGADLNTPGLARGPPFPSKATKGSVVAVASNENPTVPLVLGVCLLEVSALTEVSGQKGHAVRPMHFQGDEIWSWGPSGHKGGASPPIDTWPLETPMGINNVPCLHDTSSGKDERIEQPVDSSGQPSLMNIRGRGHLSTTSTKIWDLHEIDLAFKNAFIYSLHEACKARKGEKNHGFSFPISQSQFMSSLVTPFLPIFTAQDAVALQVKKTSWKTVKNFIKALEKDLLLRSKHRNGGECVILDVDFDDQAVINFVPYHLPDKHVINRSAKHIPVRGPIVSADDSVNQKLQRLVLFQPKERMSPLFGASSLDRLYSTWEIKAAVTEYIEKEALIDTQNRRHVRLDPTLVDAVAVIGSSSGTEIIAQRPMLRDVLIEHVIGSCSQYWVLLRNGESREAAKPKAGKPPTIKIVVENRSGSKIVTRVSGLETYYVIPEKLAEELQKSCASSTTTLPIQGGKPKTNLMEVMVQGPQKDIIIRALEKRGIKKDWVEITDKTKGKGK